MTETIVGEIKLTILLRITIIYVYLMMVLIHICTQLQLNDGSYTYLHPATGTFTAIHLSLWSLSIRMEIDFMVESDTYIMLVIIFLLF